jgi:CDP-diacylglycerol--serine O-phosphatidyltransferase
VSTIQFRSFKDMKLNWRTMSMMGLAFASTLGIALRFGPAFALPWILCSYIAIALIETVVMFPRRRAARREERRLLAEESKIAAAPKTSDAE